MDSFDFSTLTLMVMIAIVNWRVVRIQRTLDRMDIEPAEQGDLADAGLTRAWWPWALLAVGVVVAAWWKWGSF